MLKVVVYDNGYGGELFADKLESELPILNVIRVIDWRNRDAFQSSPKSARKIAESTLRPYFGNVDLIVFANYLIALTSLKYFCKKYKDQAFLGLHLTESSSVLKKNILILGTKTISHQLQYKSYLFHLKSKSFTICLDEWPNLIDDGELTMDTVHNKFEQSLPKKYPKPDGLILACSQFYDIKDELRNVFGKNIKIYDDFTTLTDGVVKKLKIRGARAKKK